MSVPLLQCPRCGGFDPFHPDTPKDAKTCTPSKCSAWKITARLTKEGQKPLREDGRADLGAVAGSTPEEET